MALPKTASYDFDCDECGEEILEDDEFYFISDRDGGYARVCPDCHEALMGHE